MKFNLYVSSKIIKIILISIIFIFVGCAKNVSPTDGAIFEFTDASKKYFRILLEDPGKIETARRIIRGEVKKHVTGIIIKKTASYNPKWGYHLDPNTISFAGFSMEICDATIQFTEDHLDEVGGSFLPSNQWCPWTSKVIREIK